MLNKLNDNPITKKISRMVEVAYMLTKTCPNCQEKIPIGPASWESICVATGMKFQTLRNILSRPKISYVTRMILLKEGYIDHDDIKQYEAWLSEHGISQDMRGRVKPLRKKIACNPPEYPEPVGGHQETSPTTEE